MIKPETYRAIVSGQRTDVAAAFARSLLAVAEVPYRGVVTYRNRRYDRGHSSIHRMPVPVISVGNLTLGGTGKTPVVAWLAKWYRDHQRRVAIISRGYRADLAEGNEGNDEMKELAARLPDVPQVQNPDRVTAARLAIDQSQTQLIVLDDAFQHRRIARDLDVVLIDATCPFGYDHVFPRGLLREPVDGLKRADVIALTRCDLVDTRIRDELHSRLTQLAPQALWLEVAQQPATLLSATGAELSREAWPAGPLLAFCGIGNPDAFRQTLIGQGWMLEDFRAFPDHHRYDAATLAKLETWAKDYPAAAAVVCTHKDLVKIDRDRLGTRPLYALKLDLEFDAGLPELESRLRALLPRADEGPSSVQ